VCITLNKMHIHKLNGVRCGEGQPPCPEIILIKFVSEIDIKLPGLRHYL